MHYFFDIFDKYNITILYTVMSQYVANKLLNTNINTIRYVTYALNTLIVVGGSWFWISQGGLSNLIPKTFTLESFVKFMMWLILILTIVDIVMHYASKKNNNSKLDHIGLWLLVSPWIVCLALMIGILVPHSRT